MHYTKEQHNSVLVLRIEEVRFDSTVSPEFKAELLRIIEKEQVENILIDLKEVQYVDSSGLGALLFGHRQIKSKSGKFKLVNVNPKIQTLIKIAKLEGILDCFDDETAALESFS